MIDGIKPNRRHGNVVYYRRLVVPLRQHHKHPTKRQAPTPKPSIEPKPAKTLPTSFKPRVAHSALVDGFITPKPQKPPQPATLTEPAPHIPAHIKSVQLEEIPNLVHHQSRSRRRWPVVFSVVVACVILAVSGYIIYDTWSTNQEAKKQISRGSSSSNDNREGRDETSVSGANVDKYSVAGDLPRVLTIPAIKVKTRVLPMSVKSDNQLQAPANIFDAGWYNASAKPGNPGAILIDGHVSGPTKPGIFKKLTALRQGDIIELDNGARQKFSFAVQKVETIPLQDVDMIQLLRPYGGVAKGLNLITCGGQFNAKSQTYKSRTVVYAVAVE